MDLAVKQTVLPSICAPDESPMEAPRQKKISNKDLPSKEKEENITSMRNVYQRRNVSIDQTHRGRNEHFSSHIAKIRNGKQRAKVLSVAPTKVLTKAKTFAYGSVNNELKAKAAKAEIQNAVISNKFKVCLSVFRRKGQQR
jgi:hypothetical protein